MKTSTRHIFRRGLTHRSEYQELRHVHVPVVDPGNFTGNNDKHGQNDAKTASAIKFQVGFLYLRLSITILVHIQLKFSCRSCEKMVKKVAT